MKFGNEFWLILFREYISPKLFAVPLPQVNSFKNYIPLFFLDTCSESPGSLETGEDDRARSSDASACILCD